MASKKPTDIIKELVIETNLKKSISEQIIRETALPKINNQNFSAVSRLENIVTSSKVSRILPMGIQIESSTMNFLGTQGARDLVRATQSITSKLVTPEMVGSLAKLESNLRSIALTNHQVVLPLAKQLSDLSLIASRAIVPLSSSLIKADNWKESLTKRMLSNENRWAIEQHLDVSAIGFARVARLHDIARGSSPFGAQSQEIFEEELGRPVVFDAKATPEERETSMLDSGLNPAIISFPHESYSSVLYSAGFEFRLEDGESIVSESGDETGQIDPTQNQLFARLENELRKLIVTELTRLVGDSWVKQRINGAVLKKWKERRDIDRGHRGDAFPLIYYADFMELSDIICQRNNWDDAFGRSFQSKPDFQVSMQRLAPVRNSIGHNRPLVRSDRITLFAEAYRLLNSLGFKL